jgi:glycosyltransferase involved in cell wall biosynthesis
VVAQTICPSRWVIVDDGSTDGTAALLDRYAAQCPWISVLHAPDRGARLNAWGVMEAFHFGLNSIKQLDFDFLVKLDGDVGLEPDYFERCFAEFQRDPQLGIGGGLIWNAFAGDIKSDPCPLNHVRGATKIYRRACWNALGGLERTPGWDTVDEVKAQMVGWKVRTFRHLKVLHYRPTGRAEGGWRNAVKDGHADYFTGYHPLFMLLKCIKRLFQKPCLVGSCGLLYGFVGAYVRRHPQVSDRALIRYVRAQQMRRLLFRESIWR